MLHSPQKKPLTDCCLFSSMGKQSPRREMDEDKNEELQSREEERIDSVYVFLVSSLRRDANALVVCARAVASLPHQLVISIFSKRGATAPFSRLLDSASKIVARDSLSWLSWLRNYVDNVSSFPLSLSSWILAIICWH